jgi:hypothetical protein
MEPDNPNVLWASSYERVRGPYFLQSGGPGSALWKSTDGGQTWAQVKGGGLPESTLGRIGIAIAASNPKRMYLNLEADTMPNPKPTKGAKAQERPSGLWRSDDGGATWKRMAPQNVRPFYYSQVRVDTKDPDRVYWSSTPVNLSTDGGTTVRTATQGIHVDHHAMWIDPTDPNFMVVGNDGGIGVSHDRGGSYIFPNTFPIGQFYNVSYDMSLPYNVCGGLQDNGSWCGPSRKRQGMIDNSDWKNVGGGDGFVTLQDPTDPNIIYSTSQGGNMGRVDWRTGTRVGLAKPPWRPVYTRWQDSIAAVRGDTTKPASKELTRQLAELRKQASVDSAALDLRWNWNTPFFLSHHNPKTLYFGASRVLKSVKMGDEMFVISPELSYADTMKIRISTRTTGGITPDVTSAETFGTIVSLNESPVRPGLLYAGTDDGRLWLTRNDGGSWEELTARVTGVPAGTYVSRIEPSYADTATFYVTYDNHRRGDYTPYVFATSDFGKSFRSIANNLPTGGVNFVHVIREDPTNRNLLFVGTDIGAYVSLDRGASWTKFMTGLPTVPVHDLQIHPRDRELIAGTHGRSIWIVDIQPLQQHTKEVADAPAHLFQPRPAFQFGQVMGTTMGGGGGGGGHQAFQSATAPYGGEVSYKVAAGQPVGRATITITDAAGNTVGTLTGPGSPGYHKVYWNFATQRPRAALTPAQRRDSLALIARVDKVIDSLVAAEAATKPALDSAKTQMLSGQLGFGGGGGGGGIGAAQPGIPAYQARPGEGPVVRAGAGGGGGGFGGGAMGTLIQGLGGFQALQGILGGGGGGGGGFGGQQNLVPPGDYLITVTVAGQTLKQKLRVDRARADGGLPSGQTGN